MKSQVENLMKAQRIIGADYSEYPKLLRMLLEQRKEFYKMREKALTTDDLDAIIEMYEDQIKLLLAL